MTQNKYSSSLSWQLSETKPNTKLILLCLEFNKSNKQSVCCLRPVLKETACFPSVFFKLQQYSRKHLSFSAHKAALRTKTELIFPAFSLTFVDFGVQFCFCCKLSFHEKPFESSLTVARFFLTNQNSLLRHSNQSDCFSLYRQQITSNGFFSCLPKWAKAGFRVIEKDFEIKS